MKKKIIIIGSGSQAKLLCEGILENNFEVSAFFDNNKKTKNNYLILNKKKYLLLKRINQLSEYIKKKFFFICAVGSNYKREKIVLNFEKLYPKIKWYSYCAKNTIIPKSVKIGEGSVLMRGVVINSFSNIGKHCLLNTASLIEHDNIFKDYSSIGPGVKTSGNVSIGLRSHIGTGSVIKNNIEIEDNVVVGIGSVVVKNCKKNSVYFGIPAKLKKKRKINQSYY